MISLWPFVSTAQKIKPLTIGDKVPDIVFNDIVNYKTSSAEFLSFGTPILLDFFGTHCRGCISALPYFNKLKRELKDSIQIIVVSDEKKVRIQKFLRNNPMGKTNQLPFVTEDTLLSNLFPHRLIPHEIWIDKNGIVKAITLADYVNKRNLQTLISNKIMNLPLKQDYYVFDPTKSLAENALRNWSNIKFQSTLTGFMNNASIGMKGSFITEDGNYKKIYFINMPLLSMCQALLGNNFMPNRFILKIHDSSKLIHLKKNFSNDWFINHAFCYEIMVPAKMPKSEIESYILNDLGQQERIKIQVKKLQESCYILMKNKINFISDPRSKGGIPDSELFVESNQPKFLRNLPISHLVKAMNSGSFEKKYPIIIDESGYNYPVDLTLNIKDIRDITAMQKELQSYGFTLFKGLRQIEMVVIEDIN